MGKTVHISKVLSELIKHTKRYHELKNKKQLTEEEKNRTNIFKKQNSWKIWTRNRMVDVSFEHTVRVFRRKTFLKTMPTKKQVEEALWMCIKRTHSYKIYELFESNYGKMNEDTFIQQEEIDLFFETCLKIRDEINKINNQDGPKNDLTIQRE
jgi:hypothetical protein